ncbi:hypothetical protein [Pseudorhodoplanes sp.]|uniref:hypothetical protein n=1 Tax=Pseudorhodoplanes sp. TaxID=1934341 RepID=UPI002D7FA8F2|nr:hypothetical protein [Pseudorhodoplanes sp.]
MGNITANRTPKLCGYCTRCGGDCFDDGIRNFHKCPPSRPEASSIVGLKSAIDRLQMIIDRRPWAAVVRKEDCAELLVAMRDARAALAKAYPSAHDSH